MRVSDRLAWTSLRLLAAAAIFAPAMTAAAADSGSRRVWLSRDTGPRDANEYSAGVVLNPDGKTLYVVGDSEGELVIFAHDTATGARLWAVHTKSQLDEADFPKGVAISADGTRLFVTGDAQESLDTRSMLTAAFDTADGTLLWHSRLSAGPHLVLAPAAVVLNPDGRGVYVVGALTGLAGGSDYWDYLTVMYDADTGSELWTTMYAGPGLSADTPEWVGVSPDGARVYVTGTSVGEGTDRDFATVAYSAVDGSLLWQARYDAGADDYAVAGAVSPDGDRVYVTGFARAAFGAPHDYRLVAYAASTGKQLAVASYDSGHSDVPAALALSPDGQRLYVTGTSAGDYATIAYDTAASSRVWGARYDGGKGRDQAASIAVSPDGSRVYVTGESAEGRTACGGGFKATDYLTVSYDADTGTKLWQMRYGRESKAPDRPSTVAVSPDGSLVFVTGTSEAACSSSDLVTIAYRP